MEENNRNNIRPVKIRIVNPTPKSSQGGSVDDKKIERLGYLNLIFFIVIASLIFFILKTLNIWNKILPFSSAWKIHTFNLLIYLCIVFIIPFFIFLIIKPSILHFVDFRIKPVTAILCLMIGFPFAYMMGVVNSILSILITKIGFSNSYWLLGSELQFYANNSMWHKVVFLLTICILPSIIKEILLRSVLLSELLHKKRQNKAIIYSSLLTGLLMFQWHSFIPYLGLGLLVSFIFIYHKTGTATILCHFSFNLTYHYLMVKIPWLNFNQTLNSFRGFETLIPIILKSLLAACVFIPLIIVLSQMKKMNPLFEADEIIARHTKRKQAGNKLLLMSLLALIIVFIIFADS